MKGSTIRRILALLLVLLAWGHLLWINMTQLQSVYGHVIAIPLLMLVTLVAALQVIPGKSESKGESPAQKQRGWSCWNV